jgi:phosphatidylserine/phosphatidylglycerophosphate/cardiolipin synthase-like enzyme
MSVKPVKLIIQPEAGVMPIVQAVRRARKSVAIYIFRFDRSELERELEAAVRRGVKVRALIAHTNRGGESRLRKLEQRLLAQGVTVARTADDLLRYHGKFLIADDTLHVFGFNFTKLDIDKSRSFAIATRDRKTVNEACKLFEADASRQPYTPARSNLIVSPETARTQLSDFISGARRELAIYDEKIQDPSMVRLLKERASKGVRIRVIGQLKGPNGAIQVTRLKGMRLHVRAIVRDGTRAFVGSQSLRKLELESRREVGLLITNPSVAGKILQTFEIDWAASRGVEETSTDKSGKPKDEKIDKKDEKAEKKEDKAAKKSDKVDKADEKKEKDAPKAEERAAVAV